MYDIWNWKNTIVGRIIVSVKSNNVTNFLAFIFYDIFLNTLHGVILNKRKTKKFMKTANKKDKINEEIFL